MEGLSMSKSRRAVAMLLQWAALSMTASLANAGTPFVPGTGEFLADCCDDFEDPTWSYRYNLPKSSH
jgi:hypothetical protein